MGDIPEGNGYDLFQFVNFDTPSPGIAHSSPCLDNSDAMHDQQTTSYRRLGSIDVHDVYQVEDNLGTYSHEQPEVNLDIAIQSSFEALNELPSSSYEHPQQEATLTYADFNDPSKQNVIVVLRPDENGLPVLSGPELTGEIGRTSEPTSQPSFTNIDGTYSSQNHCPTTSAGDTYSHKQPVEASDDCLSSPSGPLQQMGAPPLSDYILPMDPSGNNSRTASSSAEVDGTRISQDHGPTYLPVQQTPSKKSECPVCDKEFHKKKAVTRHFDDTHAEPKECPEPGCKKMIIGKRKLVTHRERVHKIIVEVPKRRVRKPGKKRQQIPKDAPLQVQSTSTQASSHQVHDA